MVCLVIQELPEPITFAGIPGTKDFPIQNTAKFFDFLRIHRSVGSFSMVNNRAKKRKCHI